jgi:methionyl-tRNA formyltransferase
MGEAHAEELGSGESDEEQRILFAASHEIRSFCLQRLPRSEFQALAFFANPPSLQSVPEVIIVASAEAVHAADTQTPLSCPTFM